MKRLMLLCLAIFIISNTNHLTAQDESTRSIGDNFSLEGSLDLFKKSSTLENFESLLNVQSSDANNLDLNDDGEVDYIRVTDYVDGDVHAIVLQAVVSEEESQDIAVIEIEKSDEEYASLQIVGNDVLYGNDHIVEPFDEVATSNGKGPSSEYVLSRVVINVWAWPSVRYIYSPKYVVYRSPFRWRVYPKLWRPWRPLTWNVYHNKRVRYNRSYRIVNTRRIVKARPIYVNKRKNSTIVIRKSKTVKIGKGDNTKIVKTTKTKKVKKNKNGVVKTKKTKKTVKKGNKRKVTKKKVKRRSGN